MKIEANALLHNPSPEYLRRIIEAKKVTTAEAASLVGISIRSLQDYLNPKHKSKAPYAVQFALENI